VITNLKNLLCLTLILSSVRVFAEVPEFNATTDKTGRIVVEEDYDPAASCNICKAMKKARLNIKKLDPKDAAQMPQIIAGHDVMLDALLNFDKVKAITTYDALPDFNAQLILLFDRLDRADNSSTAVERMAAYVENPQAKVAYRAALAKVPESMRKRIQNRIDDFNHAQQKELQQEKNRGPSSTSAAVRQAK
jgi:hypothetical protein